MPSASPSFDGAIDFARDLIRIPSLSGEEEALAQRVVSEMRSLGYDDVWTDELGSVVGVIHGGKGPRVMLSAHLDMVSAGDEEDWPVPPFEGAIRDGFLHGRGAMDIKGPLAIQTHVGAALRDMALGDVIVAHPVFEERGGWGMDRLVKEDGGLAPDIVVIGESTQGDIAIGHRGRAEIEVRAAGVAGHASAPARAKNALDHLPGILSAVQSLAAAEPVDSLLGKASVTATGVEAAPASLNVIPDRVTVTLDWRFLPEDTLDSLLARLRERLRRELGNDAPVSCRAATESQRSYTGVVEERLVFSPGFLMDPGDPIAKAAANAVGRREGPGPARIRPWTFATDGGWTMGVRGIPTIGFGPGEEKHAHTNTERLLLEDAKWSYARHLDLVPALQAAKTRLALSAEPA